MRRTTAWPGGTVAIAGAIATIGIVLGRGGSQSDSDRSLSALAFAIARFDSSHGRGLQAGSPEHAFMTAALRSVDRAIPVLSTIPEDLDPRALTSLRGWRWFGPDSGNAQWHEAFALHEALDSLVAGCPADTLIHPITADRRLVRSRHRIASRDGVDPRCVRPAAASLAAEGIALVEVDRYWERARIDDVYFSLRLEDDRLRDMMFVRNRLLEHEALRDVVAATDTIKYDPPTPTLGIQNDDVHMIRPFPRVSSRAFRIQYMRAWGDCPLGCTIFHFWLVSVRPRQPIGSCRRPECYRFDVALVREWGAPLDRR